MASVIIGIHGLGNKPPKKILEQWWKLSLAEGLRINNFNIPLPRFEMVYWADIIYEKPLDEGETNIDSPYYLDEKYTAAPEYFPVEDHNTRLKVVSFLSKQLNRIFLNEDLSINYSFIADSIVKNYFRDLEIYYSKKCSDENGNNCMVRDLIRSRLLQILEKHKKDNIFLIAHSMGSIVAYDVLSLLRNKPKINTFITIGSPLGLPVVISKIAAEQKQSLKWRNMVSTPLCITKNWFNFSDILDKVAFNFELSDDFSGNRNGVKPKDFLVINNYEIDGKRNPHKSFGYLRTPEFSETLHNFITEGELTFLRKMYGKTIKILNSLKSRQPHT